MILTPIIAQGIQRIVLQKLFQWQSSTSICLNETNVLYSTVERKKMTNKGEHVIGNFNIHAWSLSGLESTVSVKTNNEANVPKLKIAFDMGYATPQSVGCDHVFISHGHMDHIAGIVHHAMKRNLAGMKSAKYYAPLHTVETLREIARGYCKLQEDRKFIDEMSINSITPGEKIDISRSCRVMAFRTKHRVHSQGYIVYITKKSRKAEYSGCSNEEMRKLLADGVEVNEIVETPEIAYTGDTTSEIFSNLPIPDLLKVKLLITESTYIDSETKNGQTAVERARERGHIHLKEIVDNSQAFDDVEHILLMHFSTKYSVGYIENTVQALLKDHPKLYEKVHLATVMKELT